MSAEEPHHKLTTKEEVELLSIQDTRTLFTLLINMQDKKKGKRRMYVDRDSHLGTEGLIEFRSVKDPDFEVYVKLHDTQTQIAKPYDNKITQAPWNRRVNSCIQTEPATYLDEMNELIVQSDGFANFIYKVSERINPVLESNIASDVFVDRLSLLRACDDSLVKSFSITQLDEYLSLKDARYSHSVACIDVQPNNFETIAISFSPSSNQDDAFANSMFGRPEYIFIWKFTSILHPTYVLEAPSVVNVFKFCPSNPNIIVAGCESGQVLMWDLTNKDTKILAELRNTYSTEDTSSTYYHPALASTLFNQNLQPTKSHFLPVTDLVWLPPNSKVTTMGEILQSDEATTQFATTGIDGHIIFWDIAGAQSFNTEGLLPGASLKNEWYSTFCMNITKSQKDTQTIPITMLELLEDQSKLTGDIRLVTQYGEGAGFNWVTGPDRSLAGRQAPTLGPLHQLLNHAPTGFVQSPFIPGLFVGSDRSQIVLIDMRNGCTILFRSSVRNSPICSLAFSPTRPSMFVAGKENGDIEVWALLDKSHECIFSQSVSSTRVSAVEFMRTSDRKQLLLAGCGDGSLMVYRAPSFMSKPITKELEMMNGLIEMQIKFVEQSHRRSQARYRDRNGAQSDKDASEEAEKGAVEEEEENEKTDIELLQFEREYQKVIKEFMEMEKDE